jgi:uncharacterized membrane protein
MNTQYSPFQNIARNVLGSSMVLAAIAHVTFLRAEFQAQVPNWVLLDKDLVVVLSGVAELALGLSMLFWKQRRKEVGVALAVFFILIFPGNIAQYVNQTNAFYLDTDTKRLTRLFFQPVLIVWALWSTGFFKRTRRR